METFFRTTKIALKNLETFYIQQMTYDILTAMDNLRTSSSLLGFLSLAKKAEWYEQTIKREGALKAQKFAAMVSDLVFELRRCELEWTRKQDAAESLAQPLRETNEIYAVCMRR
jgi:hypothetical protein